MNVFLAILLSIFSVVTFFFSWLFGGYIAFIIFLPLIILSIIISVKFRIKSKKEGEFKFPSLAVFFIICPILIGGFMNWAEIKHTKSEISQIRDYINENYSQYLSELYNVEMSSEEYKTAQLQLTEKMESDDFFNTFFHEIVIEPESENVYKINYKDAWCYSNEDEIYLRPRP